MFKEKIVLLLVISVILIPVLLNAEWVNLNSGVSDDLYGSFFLNETTGYVSGWGSSSGGVVLKTTDGGLNWNSNIPKPGSYLFGITFIDDTTGFVVGCDAGGTFNAMILKTVDAGASWNQQLFSASYGFYIADFPTDSIGFVCGYLGAIYKTTNRGSSWIKMTTGTNNTFRWMHFVDSLTGYAVSGTQWNHPDVIHRTTDGGITWSITKSFGSSYVAGGIHFFDDTTGIIIGGDGNEGILKTTDGGYNWISKYSTSFSGTLQGLYFNGANGWAVGNGSRIHRSTDSGETWSYDTTITPSNTLLSIFEIGNTAYLTGGAGIICKNDLTVGVEESIPTEIRLDLFQNYPNPFTDKTTISFSIGENNSNQYISLSVYNLLGQKVKTLVDSEIQGGTYRIEWDRKDSKGCFVESGIYFYKLVTKYQTLTKNLIIF